MTAATAPALRRPTTSPAFVEGLRRHGDRVALVTDAETLTYAHLADRVATTAERLGHGRRLVLVETGNDVASVVAYLAALHGGHAVVLADRADRARLAALTARFDPDVVVAGGVPRQRRAGSRHTLHPELALLLATSGSSGAPRLVRLSPSALSANAAAIATALDIDPDDRAALTLPIHYCYGLSVLHSNLLVGAAIVLSDRSVLNPRFWDSAREQRVTSLHGVPYSFELFDAVGFADMTLPDLRYVTVAGGRLEPEQVRRWAAVGRERGWDLVVMYGQTEATARMACLPPALAEQHPDAVGLAVPGSSLTVDAGPDGVGELVFAGPGVMLGYAEGPADLALGRTVAALRTGDLGRVGPDGLVRVVGRLARFVKPYGLRVDLDDVERLLAEHGVVAAVEGTDARIAVAARRDGSDDLASRVVALLAGRHGMPPETFAVEVVDVLPRRPNGKIDHPAVARMADGRPSHDEVRIPAQRTAAEPRRTPNRSGWRRLLSVLGASTA